MKKERTFVMIKPDGIQRSLIGEVIRRFERTGLKLVAMKFVVADEERLWKHYNKDEAWFLKKGGGIVEDLTKAGKPVEKEALEYGKDIIRANVEFMSSGPVVMMIWEGNQSVAVIKKLVGSTEPATSDVGTIRGDLTMDSYAICSVDGRAVRNLIHCSDEVGEAKREMDLWFAPHEIVNYRLVQEQMLYDVNFDGILE